MMDLYIWLSFYEMEDKRSMFDTGISDIVV